MVVCMHSISGGTVALELTVLRVCFMHEARDSFMFSERSSFPSLKVQKIDRKRLGPILCPVCDSNIP